MHLLTFVSTLPCAANTSATLGSSSWSPDASALWETCHGPLTHLPFGKPVTVPWRICPLGNLSRSPDAQTCHGALLGNLSRSPDAPALWETCHGPLAHLPFGKPVTVPWRICPLGNLSRSPGASALWETCHGPLTHLPFGKPVTVP